MLLRSLLSTAALALSANAFLVPSTMNDKVAIPNPGALDLLNLQNHNEQVVNLDCKDCKMVFAAPRPGEFSAMVHSIEHEHTKVEMKVTNDGHTIYLNNIPIFPVNPRQPPKPLIATQTSVDTHSKGNAVLSYSMDIVSEVPIGNTFSTAIIVQILGVHDAVSDIEALAIGILKNPDGTLVLHTAHSIRNTLPPAAKQCTTLMCRAKVIIAAKIHQIQAATNRGWHRVKHACMKKFGLLHGGHQHDQNKRPLVWNKGPRVHGGIPKYAGRFPPNKHHNHHAHHAKSGIRRALCMFHKALKNIVLPILIGIGVGMVASGIGMLVGSLIVLVWRKVRGSRNAVYVPVEQVEIVEEEGRLSEESLPPRYEDVDEKKELLNEKERDEN